MSDLSNPTAAVKAAPPEHCVPRIRNLSGGGIDVRMTISTDELASLPRCVYEVSRDYLMGDISEVGRESMGMIILVLSDLLPDDLAMIEAMKLAGADTPS